MSQILLYIYISDYKKSNYQKIKLITSILSVRPRRPKIEHTTATNPYQKSLDGLNVSQYLSTSIKI